MKAVIQRVSEGSVQIEKKTVGKIKTGFVVLLGITHTDSEKEVMQLVNKTANMRIFPSDGKPINASLSDVGGEVLVISQFTLYADTRKGNRPSFTDAASPEHAQKLYDLFCEELSKTLEKEVQTGEFGAMMEVSLTNDGPVTIILES